MKDKRRKGCSNRRFEQLRIAREHKQAERSVNTDVAAASTSGVVSNINVNMIAADTRVTVTDKGDGDNPVSASRVKLLEQTHMQAYDVGHENQQWTLAHVGQIQQCISNLLCPQCLTDSVTVAITGNMGFSSELSLQCSVCDYCKHVHSSPRAEQHNSTYIINTLMTVVAHELGVAHTGLNKIAKVLGMRNMHLKTYQRHDRRVSAAEVDTGEDSLQLASQKIRRAYLATHGEEGEPDVLDICVSYDGTWMKRGFTSQYGVGVAIDILTGLVIDYEVLSLYCHACVEADRKTWTGARARIEWEEAHAPDCCVNYVGSSKSMETEAAKRIWNRSVDKYNLRYTEMLSDGDSTAFKAVQKMQPYGDDIQLSKLECVNHAHKRMGTALRKLAKAEKLGGQGSGRLTLDKCNRLQSYYRNAIQNNLGNIDDMKSAVWATLHHSMSTDAQPQHEYCPKDINSWCFYQAALAADPSDEPKHDDNPCRTALSPDIAQKIVPIYKRMSDENLLKRMLHGKTQNQNESFNATIWLRCPKTSFMGMRRVRGAVARAASAFNEGATSLTTIFHKMYIEPTETMIAACHRENRKRIRQGDLQAEKKVKNKRKATDDKKRAKLAVQEQAEGATYGAGIE